MIELQHRSTLNGIATAIIITGSVFTCLQPVNASESKKSKSFQKTDTSLLYEIETNLETYHSSGKHASQKPKKPPKQRRFELAKKGINKLVYKNALPNSLLGGVIGVAATANPAGLLLGGFAGMLQGKSDRYEEAQGKIHLMEKAIFASEPYEVTPEEVRLATYTGADLSEFIKLGTQSQSNNQSSEQNTLEVTNDSPPHSIQQTVLTPVTPPPPDVDYCHDLAMGNTKPVDNTTRRELVSFCFYHMN